MRRRFIIGVVSLAVAVAGFDLLGSTADALGTRSVATVAAITMTNVAHATTLATTWDTTVTEVGRSGTNPWSIQGTLLGGKVSYLTNNIPASSFVLSGITAPTPTNGGGVWAAGAGGALNNDGVTGTPLCRNSGQSTSSIYTGTYDCHGTITLTPPNNTVEGAYTGTFVVTLID